LPLFLLGLEGLLGPFLQEFLQLVVGPLHLLLGVGRTGLGNIPLSRHEALVMGFRLGCVQTPFSMSRLQKIHVAPKASQVPRRAGAFSFDGLNPGRLGIKGENFLQDGHQNPIVPEIVPVRPAISLSDRHVRPPDTLPHSPRRDNEPILSTTKSSPKRDETATVCPHNPLSPETQASEGDR